MLKCLQCRLKVLDVCVKCAGVGCVFCMDLAVIVVYVRPKIGDGVVLLLAVLISYIWRWRAAAGCSYILYLEMECCCWLLLYLISAFYMPLIIEFD